MASFGRCAVTAGSQHCGLPPQVLHLGASAGLPAAAAAGAGLSARAEPCGRYATPTPRVELSASRVRSRRGDEGWDDEARDDDVERDRDVGMLMTSEGQHPNTTVDPESFPRHFLELRGGAFC